MNHPDIPFEQYEIQPASCHPYDPQFPVVAAHLQFLISRFLPDVEIHHSAAWLFRGVPARA